MARATIKAVLYNQPVVKGESRFADYLIGLVALAAYKNHVPRLRYGRSDSIASRLSAFRKQPFGAGASSSGAKKGIEVLFTPSSI